MILEEEVFVIKSKGPAKGGPTDKRQKQPGGNSPSKQKKEEKEEKKGDDGAGVVEKVPMIPCLMLEVDFNNVGVLATRPPEMSFHDKIGAVMVEAVQTLAAPEALLGHDELAPYTQAATDDVEEAGEPAEVDMIVAESDGYKRCVESITARLSQAFERVTAFMDIFAKYDNVYKENEAAEEELHVLLRTADLAEFEKYINQYSGQITEFMDVPRVSDIGSIRVDSRALKMRLMPSPVRCLAAIQALLPVILGDKNKVLLDELMDKQTKLAATPEDVEEFTSQVKFYEKVKLEAEAVAEQNKVIRQVENLMKKNKWEIPDTEVSHNSVIKATLKDVDGRVEAMENNLEEETTKWVAKINETVPKIKKEGMQVRSELDDQMIGDVNKLENETETVIEFLLVQQKEVLRLRSKAQQFQQYQELLQQEPADYEELEETYVDMKIKVGLWEGIRDWDTLTKALDDTELDKIDTEGINREIQNYTKLVGQATRGLPGNMVVPILKERVEAFKKLMPAVMDLRNPHLLDRHWREIEEIIDHKFDNDKSYTLGELVDLNVIVHQEAIQAVSVKAIQENALTEMFEQKVLKVWKDMDFIVNSYKESKQVRVNHDYYDNYDKYDYTRVPMQERTWLSSVY